MVERAVPGFLPSLHGLHFANSFPPGPTVRFGPFDTRIIGIGDAAAGLCGGMAMTARDLWAAGVNSPADTAAPDNGSRRFNALVRRQVQSLDWMRVPLRYAWLAALAGPLRRGPVSVSTLQDAWPLVRAEIDAGRPCLLELIRAGGFTLGALTQNHQVLAFAYSETADASGSQVRLRVYDPNHPGADDVVLELVTAPEDGRAIAERLTLRQSTGEPLLGFFRGPVLENESVAAWR